ncbi:MAG: UDP-N-acetylglucosamine diphosphorylase/glucosamine-1-phosphate N-acetyltransferase [Nitrospirae bacterium]|nr:MAG: UDP-N-acetylglucosamine diphosphorylase/glucosamine-1-phosphate N-acetyltransferase [Nitrospirota bacterium]
MRKSCDQRPEANGRVNDTAVIILAAGLGKRMRSKMAKVLHPVAGQPMVWHVVRLAASMTRLPVVVVLGHQAERVQTFLAERRKELPPFEVALQPQQRGTGDAVKQAVQVFAAQQTVFPRVCVILNGDTPLLRESTVNMLVAHHCVHRAAITILTAQLDDPTGYGRVLRDAHGQVRKIVEDRDATPDELLTKEVNVGTYVVDGAFLPQALAQLTPYNTQGEYYLTDLVEIAITQGKRVEAVQAEDAIECLGVNTREHLAVAEQVMRQRIRKHWLDAGVTMLDPQTTFIDATVTIGCDTVLYPHVALEGKTTIGEACVIRAHSRVTRCQLQDQVVVEDCCVLEDALVEEGCVIGPFARLRPGTRVRKRAKVGNFVELKNTELGEESKANHLAYLGDAQIGRQVNIGAGTITCNYDGFRKSRTVIDDEVFIGSDTQLIAPVTIGKGAVIGAGSTITQDVPADALALSRAQQVTRMGGASRRRALHDKHSSVSSSNNPTRHPHGASS